VVFRGGHSQTSQTKKAAENFFVIAMNQFHLPSKSDYQTLRTSTYAVPAVLLGLSFDASKRRGNQRRTERQYTSYGAPNVERRCGSS
jgi:hypothetical protein